MYTRLALKQRLAAVGRQRSGGAHLHGVVEGALVADAVDDAVHRASHRAAPPQHLVQQLRRRLRRHELVEHAHVVRGHAQVRLQLLERAVDVKRGHVVRRRRLALRRIRGGGAAVAKLRGEDGGAVGGVEAVEDGLVNLWLRRRAVRRGTRLALHARH